MDLNEIKKELTETLGDEEKEVFLDILAQLKASVKSSEKLDKLEKTIQEGNQSSLEAMRDIIKVAKELKISLPETFQVWVKNQQLFPKEIKVSNIKEIIIPEKVEIKETKWLEKYIIPLAKLIVKLPEEIANKILRVDIVSPRTPDKAIPVRLSDGKRFYNAILSMVSGGGRGSPFRTASGQFDDALIDSSRHLQVDILTLSEAVPTDATKNNPSFALTYTSGDLTQINMTIGVVVYRKTLTYTGGDLTSISAWSVV